VAANWSRPEGLLGGVGLPALVKDVSELLVLDDPLKINDEVVAAEVRSLLQIDNSRLGEVWKLNLKRSIRLLGMAKPAGG